jgi:endonuclease/exonuclease/phosphatase (EEP) superfamily protein YafD
VISLPPIINSLLIALLMFWALSVRFRNFRLAGVWILALGAALLMGALAPIGFSIRDGQILAAIRFTVVPWAVLAGCIGFGLSSRPDPLR